MKSQAKNKEKILKQKKHNKKQKQREDKIICTKS